MTTKDIDTLPAGRELDAMVAEKVMGWTSVINFGDKRPPGHDQSDGPFVSGKPPKPSESMFQEVPKYSTDVAAAFEMIQSLREDDRVPYIEILPMRGGRCEVRNADDVFANASAGTFSVEADTAPLAMCQFALKAVTR